MWRGIYQEHGHDLSRSQPSGDLLPDDLSAATVIIMQMKCTINVMCLRSSPNHPLSPHSPWGNSCKTGSWCQKGWGPLCPKRMKILLLLCLMMKGPGSEPFRAFREKKRKLLVTCREGAIDSLAKPGSRMKECLAGYLEQLSKSNNR